MIYCYRSECGGKTIERHYTMGNAPSNVKVAGVLYWRDFKTETATQYHTVKGTETPVNRGCKTWPQASLRNAVAPQQAKAAMEIDQRLGVPTEYKKVKSGRLGVDARPVFTSQKHRDKWEKAHGERP